MALIATWDFGLEAVQVASKILVDEKRNTESYSSVALDAVVKGIEAVELNSQVASVGYGGIPNANGVLQLDAALVTSDGRCGAVLALEGFPAAIPVARLVLERSKHTCLCSSGAKEFAEKSGMVPKDNSYLLSLYAKKRYAEYITSGKVTKELSDTVGLICLDKEKNMVAGCATSGAAFKENGRVGDSAIIGSGLYLDAQFGAATSTGDGDIIMRYCCAFQLVQWMQSGMAPQSACQAMVAKLRKREPNCQAAFVAMVGKLHNCKNKKGTIGAYSTHKGFSYAFWNEKDGACINSVFLNEQDAPVWKHLC